MGNSLKVHDKFLPFWLIFAINLASTELMEPNYVSNM